MAKIAINRRVFLAGSLFIGGGIVGQLGGCKPYQPDDSSPNKPIPPTPTSAQKELIDALIQGGWSREAADAVWKLNQRYFTLLWEEEELGLRRNGEGSGNISRGPADRSLWNQTIGLFSRLGELKYRVIQKDLVRYPELTALLAYSLESNDRGPQLILRSIPSDSQERQAVLTLYQFFYEPTDSVRIAEALIRDRDIILPVYFRTGSLDCVGFFLDLKETDPADQVYRQWVRELFQSALADHDSRILDWCYILLVIHRDRVRELLRKEPKFRESFLTKYWPRFSKHLREIWRHTPSSPIPTDKEDTVEVSDGDLEWLAYGCDPRVWEYYHRFSEEGDDIYDNYDRYGSIAVELTLDPFYQDVLPLVLATLRDADELVLNALLHPDLRGNSLFKALLQRNIPPGSRAKALHILLCQPPEAPGKLSSWAGLSDEALIEELGPPPEGIKTWIPGYYIYYVGKKISQGRTVDGWDIVCAVADIATVVLVPSGGGQIGKQVSTKLAQKGIVRGGAKVGQMGAKEIAPLVNRAARTQGRAVLKQIGSKGVQEGVDVTNFFRYLFKSANALGIGRKTFRSITGLEARVFMRPDRRVFFYSKHLFPSNPILKYLLLETAENAGFDLAGGILVPEITEIWKAWKIKRAEKEETGEAPPTPDVAWRQHLSLWWIAAALDQFTPSLPKEEKQ